ncbi:MAG: MBL fold metallo-hydrolase [Gammaproteobacteria bacterium]|nr:MBL fold metallo-hydrolase [Gammaproteobacteria bacterium]
MQYQIIPVTPYQQNCSLISCPQTAVSAFVDPGGDIDRLVDALQKSATNLQKILLTHGHLDHVGAARLLADRFGVPIIGPHSADAYWLQALGQQAQMFGFEDLAPFLPDQWLNDGDTVQVGEQVLSVLHTPGHTPGHVVFYHRENQLAFVGDVLFQSSIGRTDFPGGDYDTLIHSIKHKLLPLGDDVSFVPGHGPMSTFGKERLHNPFLK